LGIGQSQNARGEDSETGIFEMCDDLSCLAGAEGVRFDDCKSLGSSHVIVS
jgi:hypothetical protein